MKDKEVDQYEKDVDELTEYLQQQHTGVTRESVEKMIHFIFQKAEERKNVQE
jgi:hypothetical protein